MGGGEKSRGAKQILDKALQCQTRALVSLPTCRSRGQRPGHVRLLCSGAAPLRRELEESGYQIVEALHWVLRPGYPRNQTL